MKMAKITPEMIAKAGTEHAEQAALLCWCNEQAKIDPRYALLFAIPNGGGRSPSQGARLKAEGVKPGVPDLFLPVAIAGWHGLFIEMKRANGGTVSAQQVEWRNCLLDQGYGWSVAHGWIEAKEILQSYLTYNAGLVTLALSD